MLFPFEICAVVLWSDVISMWPVVGDLDPHRTGSTPQEVSISNPYTILFIASNSWFRGCAQFIFQGINFTARVRKLPLLLVDGVGQGGVVVGNLGKVLFVLIKLWAAVHVRGFHIFQVAGQGVHHILVWCAVLFETTRCFCFFSQPWVCCQASIMSAFLWLNYHAELGGGVGLLVCGLPFFPCAIGGRQFFLLLVLSG